MSKITSFFAPVSKPSTTLSIIPPKKEDSASKETTLDVTTPSAMIAFYESLTPKQRLAHQIAAKALGTSYDVQRTHDYNNWLKK